ncbi:GNAT family N-acetyltransferase [Halotia wernerae UHCC 0503]|nr:GNAT family N-acetyltransferase [Halotia wernerae UHCC 0503]
MEIPNSCTLELITHQEGRNAGFDEFALYHSTSKKEIGSSFFVPEHKRAEFTHKLNYLKGWEYHVTEIPGGFHWIDRIIVSREFLRQGYGSMLLDKTCTYLRDECEDLPIALKVDDYTFGKEDHHLRLGKNELFQWYSQHGFQRILDTNYMIYGGTQSWQQAVQQHFEEVNQENLKYFSKLISIAGEQGDF